MKQRTTGSYIVTALAAMVVVVLIFLRAASIEAVYPIERFGRILSDKVWSRACGIWKGAEARAENIHLRREIASLAMMRTDIERLEVENARLRRALGYVSKNPKEWVSAGVLSKGGASSLAHKTIRTNKGINDGIERGAIVSVPDGLVGIVVGVTPHTSEIMLITDPSLKVACSVEGHPDRRGISCGGTDELLELRYAGDMSDIPVRSTLITSGLGGIFPKGIRVGSLVNGNIEPAVDFTALEDVFIRREK